MAFKVLLPLLAAAPALAAGNAGIALTAPERIAAAKAAGFRVQGATIFNECDAAADMISFERQDLNGDGVDEIVVADGGACYGAAGAMFVVLRKVGTAWQPVLTARGIMSPLPERHDGWRDIEIGGPGFGKIPVARWNGARYVY